MISIYQFLKWNDKCKPAAIHKTYSRNILRCALLSGPLRFDSFRLVEVCIVCAQIKMNVDYDFQHFTISLGNVVRVMHGMLIARFIAKSCSYTNFYILKEYLLIL